MPSRPSGKGGLWVRNKQVISEGSGCEWTCFEFGLNLALTLGRPCHFRIEILHEVYTNKYEVII